jgi:hypothetical protein
MRLRKTVLLTAIVMGLTFYAVDCPAAMTPGQMMQCCRACMPHGQGQSCCQTMPSTHPPFIQASSIEVSAAHAAAIAIVPPIAAPVARDLRAGAVNAGWHAPPISPLTASSTPLRI